MTATGPLRAYRQLEAVLARAREECRLAYQFNPNSYTSGALRDVVAAQVALEVLGEEISALSDEEGVRRT